MLYRAATKDDLPDVQTLIDASDLKKFLAVDLDGFILVAELRGEIIGCVWAMTCGRHAFVDYLVIRNDWQHSGIGIKLIARMFRALGDLGVRFVRGIVASDHEEMLKVYRLFGATMSPNNTYVTGDLHGR